MLAKYPTFSFIMALVIIFGLMGGTVYLLRGNSYQEGYEQGLKEAESKTANEVDL